MKDNPDTKKMYRSLVDRMVGGVCGGFAEYFNIDVTVVRIIWVLFSLFGGVGLVAYLACLIVMKENPHQDIADRKKNKNTGLIIGIVLIFSGLALFSSHWNWGFHFFRPFRFTLFRPWFFSWNNFFPLLIIAIGVYYIYHTMKKDKTSEAAKKKICRNSEDKMIGGVCSGLASYLKVDPVLIRVLWILLTIFSAVIFGVIAYIVLLIVLPEGDESVIKKTVDSSKTATTEKKSRGKSTGGNKKEKSK